MKIIFPDYNTGSLLKKKKKKGIHKKWNSYLIPLSKGNDLIFLVYLSKVFISYISFIKTKVGSYSIWQCILYTWRMYVDTFLYYIQYWNVLNQSNMYLIKYPPTSIPKCSHVFKVFFCNYFHFSNISTIIF